MQISASRRVVGRIGQHAVKASGRDFRVRLPQIAADDAKAVRNSVFLRVFPRLPRSGLLNFNAAYAQCLIRAQQQKPQRPAPAAKIKHSAARLYPAEICQHHGICTHAKLCVRDFHPDAVKEKLFHTRSNQKSIKKTGGAARSTPFLVMCLFLRDCVVGAFCSAGTAVHALISVDDVLVFALADAADGTCVSASTALYTVVIDYVCHLKHLHFQGSFILSYFPENAMKKV